MQWEATDQFGNLYVASTTSATHEELKQDLASLVDEVLRRHGSDVTFAVDAEFGEVSAPDVSKVSHCVQVEVLASKQFSTEAVQTILQELLTEVGATEAKVQGPWPN